MSPTLWIIAGLIASLCLGIVSSWIYDLLKDRVFPNRPSIRAIVVITVITASMIICATVAQTFGQPPPTPDPVHDTTQATLIAVGEKQLQIQREIAAAQSQMATEQASKPDIGAATEVAHKLADLSSTQQALSSEATRIASNRPTQVPIATENNLPNISTQVSSPAPEPSRLPTKMPVETALPQVTARPLATASRNIVRVYADNSTGNFEIYAEYSDSTKANLTNFWAEDTRPKLSPDGRKILFNSLRYDGPGGYQMYVMNTDGSRVRRLTNVAGYCYEGDWSPDGKLIACTCTGETFFDVYIVNADGSGQKNLTAGYGDNRDLKWLPDGRITFQSNRDGAYQTYVMNSDGSNQMLYQP